MSASAEITLKEVYDVVVEVRTRVTSIETEMSHTSSKVKDHESRLRSLEKLVWGAAGIGAVGGASLSQVVTVLLQN